MVIKSRITLLIIIIVLFQVFSFLIYGQSLKYPLVGDDYSVIFNSLHGKFNFAKIWFNRFGNAKYYRPIGFYIYRLDFLLGGLNPYFYHFINIVLHGLSCTLIFFMTYLLLNGSIFISLCPALFFMAHPINCTTVNWVSASPELLCCFFILLTIISYHRFLNLSPKRGIYLVFPVLTFFFALATKEHAFTLPVLLLICDIWHSRRDPVKNRIKRILPFFILFGIFITLRYLALKEIFWKGYAAHSLFDYRHIFENIFRAVKLIVFPMRVILSRASYVYFSFSALILISALPLFFRDKKVIFSLLWFFISMGTLYNLPALPSYNLYLQNIGFCLFIPFITKFYAKLFFKNNKILKTLAVVGIVFILLSVYSMLTIKRNIYAQKASEASDKFIKGILKIYPRYPRGSTFYFINVPHLLAENQIYANSELVASALSLNYGLYHKMIPAYAFTYMEDTLKVENEIEIEIKDTKTLIISSKDVYFSYRSWDPEAEYVLAEEIDNHNLAAKKSFIAAQKIKLILEEKTIKNPNKHFFYFSNGAIYELKGWGQ